ncbi:MAG: hypothetical protein JWO32_456 [Bacteroidetes bacterium]|nr:hypothetical protein [Bacteroidota bacterium]
MKLKTISLLAAYILSSAVLIAQKNVTKINLLPGPAFFMFGVSQERAIGERTSIQTTFKYMPSVKFPASDYLGASYNGQTANPFANSKSTAFGNVTELRIYGKEKKALRGFYWGPYVTVNVFDIKSSPFPGQFKDDNGVTYSGDIQQNLKLTMFGGGLEIGIQKLIKDKIALDWTILGVGLGWVNMQGSIVATNTSSNFDFRNYTKDINSATQGFEQFIPIDKTIEPEKVSMSIKSLAPVLRTGLAIGFGY